MTIICCSIIYIFAVLLIWAFIYGATKKTGGN